MFLTYKVKEQLCVKADQYTHNLGKAVKEIILKKYLYKITKMGVCVRIKSIQIVDNVILRKEADMLVTVNVQMVVINLIPNQYFEGEVVECDEHHGIIVKFMGILQGRIRPQSLHNGSFFNGNWMLPFGTHNAFAWKVGEKVRFRIEKAEWLSEGKRMSDLIQLKANEQGLGPVCWWVS